MIALGALLGGSARGATTCGTTTSAARGGSLINQTLCVRHTKASGPTAAPGQALHATPGGCRPPLLTC
jgi:hypothetical protein